MRYNETYIEQLLEKFMNGESSLEEEALLGDYFRGKDVPPRWEEYRQMFAFFDNGMKENFETPISEAAIPHARAVLPGKFQKVWPWLAAAACLMLVFCLAGIYKLSGSKDTQTAQGNTNVTQSAEVKTTDKTETEPEVSICPPQNRILPRKKRKNLPAKKQETDLKWNGKETEEALEGIMQMQMEIAAVEQEFVQLNNEMAATDKEIAAATDEYIRFQQEATEATANKIIIE